LRVEAAFLEGAPLVLLAGERAALLLALRVTVLPPGLAAPFEDPAMP
jgi:hypothetical protein